MRSEIGNFHVKDVIFGDKTSFKDGILTIDKAEALEFIRQDEHIIELELEIARPRDNTRIVPVKEAVEPRTRPDGRPVFPGVTGEVEMVGSGRVHALKGVSVLGVGMHYGSFGDGLIEMGGEGAKYTLFSQLINVCIVAHTDEEYERFEQQKKNTAIRMAAHKFAEYLGQTVKDQEPEDIEVFELEPVTKRDEAVNKLPSVVLVMQPQSQMEELGYNDLVYGWDMNKFVPTLKEEEV